MEDEGKYLDHTSGLAATDGVWHHIAVSWQSSDGRVSLYDNGRKVALPPSHWLADACSSAAWHCSIQRLRDSSLCSLTTCSWTHGWSAWLTLRLQELTHPGRQAAEHRVSRCGRWCGQPASSCPQEVLWSLAGSRIVLVAALTPMQVNLCLPLSDQIVSGVHGSYIVLASSLPGCPRCEVTLCERSAVR